MVKIINMLLMRARLKYALLMISVFFLLLGSASYVNGETNLEGDLNYDLKVNIFDLVLVAKDFGKKSEG